MEKWLPTVRVTSMFTLLTYTIWFGEHRCFIVICIKSFRNGSHPFVQMCFKSISAYALFASQCVCQHVMALNSLSIYLAVECWIFVLNFSLRSWYCCWLNPAVFIFYLIWHLMFSFFASICCHALIVKNLSSPF